ncbi:hypothetical protein BDZ45DRAFT_746777 [Acephala macrosclerotiorum]|nr:hypothetical protein BDZ45DRAFT_746777 [Acephala macrosclerotiorum]
MTIRTNPFHLSNRHQIEISDEFMNLDEQTKAARLEVACQNYYDTYLGDVALLLANRNAFPYLELLSWLDASPLPPLLLNSLTNTRFQHLRLSRVPIAEYHKINPPTASSGWPLRSLVLSMNPMFKLWKTGLTAKQGVSILRQCEPTLEISKWENIRDSMILSRILSP